MSVEPNRRPNCLTRYEKTHFVDRPAAARFVSTKLRTDRSTRVMYAVSGFLGKEEEKKKKNDNNDRDAIFVV